MRTIEETLRELRNGDIEKHVEAFNLVEQIELEESAKTDFIDKFGEDTFNNFVKAKDRLVNKGYSPDFGRYLKKSKEEVDNLILSLYDDEKDSQKKRIIQGTDKEIRGKYRDLGIKSGYHIYEPLDVYASMDLGVNTGWCTTGRYGHYGHPEFTPSITDAEKHWNSYTKKGVRFFYLLDPNTMYGKYAIALYPKVIKRNNIEVGKYNIKRSNIEIYNDRDDLDYAPYKQLDLSSIINEKVVFEADVLDEVEIKDNILIKYRGVDPVFKIPDSITSIGERAFKGCRSLTSITIPNSVTSIGEQAFGDCSNLTSVTIGNSVTSIGKWAFCHCYSLTTVSIGNSVTSIGRYAFSGCSSLTSIDIPDSVTSIGEDVFSDCESLESIVVDSGNTKYHSKDNCLIETATNTLILGCKNSIMPDYVTSIGNSAFYGCGNLENVTVGNDVMSIGDFAFSGCRSLASITIPDSVKSIGVSAFSYCKSLRKVTIGKGVTKINYGAFNETSVKEFDYTGTNPDIIKELSNYAAVVNPETGDILSKRNIEIDAYRKR